MKNKLNFYTKLISTILDSYCTYVVTVENSDIKLISFSGNKPFDLDALKLIVKNFDPAKKSYSIVDVNEFKNTIKNENFDLKSLNSIGYLSILDENKTIIGYLITSFIKPVNFSKSQEKTIPLLSNEISEKLQKNKSDTTKKLNTSKSKESLLQESNNKYKYLFDNNPLPLFIWDFETLKIIDCNIESLILYGYTREEFLQLTIKDIRPKEDIDLIIKVTENENIYGEIHKKGWRHLKKNGELMYVEITAHLLDYNNRRCSLVLIKDITENIELEKKQNEHLQFIETTFENLPIGIAVNKIDDGFATLMNSKFHEIYGWPKQDLTDVATFFEKVYPDQDYRTKIVNQVISDISSKDPERMNWEGITITTQNGEKRIINAKNIPIYDQNLMISTVVDVTEKFNIEKKLLESNERYNYVTKATSDAIWDWDFENNIIYRAEGFKTIFGFDLEELNSLNTNWNHYIHPDDRIEAFTSILDTIKSVDNYWKHEYRIIKPNGHVAFVQDSAYIIRGENNNVTRVIGALQDVTQRKKEEQQLKLFASVATNTNDSVLITEAEPFDEPGPKILYVNDAFTKMTGYTAEEVIGKTPRILQGSKSDRAELERVRKALENWESCEATLINYKKNGEEFWINFTLSPVADENGWFTHWIAIERDVTTRKNEELQNELIADISTLFSEPLQLHETLDGIIRHITNFDNFCFAEAWLASSDQNILKKISSHAATENMILFQEETNAVDTFDYGVGFSGVVAKTKEITIWGDLANQKELRRRDAALKYGLKTVIGLPLLYNNEVIGVLAFGLDHEVIETTKYHTLLKKLGDYLSPEIKRKQLELELNQMFNFAPDLIVTIGLDSCFKRVNPAACKLLEYTQEELCAEHYTYFVHPDDREISENEISKLLENKFSNNFENRYITKSGKIKWLSWNAIYVPEDNNIYAVAKDITENKELEELLRKVNELARIGGWEMDLQKNTLFWSDITKEIIEVSPDFIPGIEMAIAFYKNDSYRTKITEYVQQARNTGKSWDDEFEIVTAKGNNRWIRVMGDAEFVNGNCIRIYGSMQDIDERKKAEEELRSAIEKAQESDARFKSYTQQSPIAIYTTDINGDCIYANETWLQMADMQLEDALGKGWINALHPEDLEYVTDNWYKSIESKGEWNYEYRFLNSNKNIIWVSGSAKKLFNDKNEHIGYLGSNLNISERKKAESKLIENENYLRTILDNEPECVKVLNSKGELLSMNPAGLAMIEADNEQQVLGQRMSDLVNKKYQIGFNRLSKEVFKGNSGIFEFEITGLKGRHRWLETHAVPLKDTTGKTLNLLGVTRDITERKKAEEEIKNTEDRRKLIMNAALDAIICIDKEGMVTFWNPQAEHIFGWSENEVMGKVLSSVIIPENFRSMHDNGMKNYLKTGQGPALNVLLELSAIRRNGTEFPIELSVLPLLQDGEEFFCAFIRDITERKTHQDQLLQLNKDLNKQKAELITSNKELEQFAFVASHDLQEPLRMVTSFLTLIEKRYNNSLDEKGIKYINFAVEGAKNMRQIILDILEFSRINNENNSNEDKYEFIDLKDIITDISLLQGKLINEKKAKIIFEELPKFYSIRHYLMQLFQNIISNALKYSKENVPLQIHINSEEHTNYYQIAIKDNGIGIEKEYFEKIFIIFQRLHGKEKYEGNGMGLAIAKKIVDKLNGKIWVESQAGIGSTFYINIPKK